MTKVCLDGSIWDLQRAKCSVPCPEPCVLLLLVQYFTAISSLLTISLVIMCFSVRLHLSFAIQENKPSTFTAFVPASLTMSLWLLRKSPKLCVALEH